MANLVEKIAESVTSVGVKRSYGDPITIDGIQLVPVALTWYGFGGGGDDSVEGTSGSDAATGGDATGDATGGDTTGGSGGGGGGGSIPVGVYSTGPYGAVRFEPNLIALVAVAIPLVAVSGRAVARIVRALKK